jgi:hypothetical protein
VTAKRSSGQCLGAATRCVPDVGGDAWHGPGCPLYPPQCTCGEPDALTKLERLVRVRRGMSADTFEHEALALIAQAREERKALKADNATHRTAMVRAAAELRHTYGHVAPGQHINPDLVSRAIRLLEGTATQPHPGATLLIELEELRKYAATAHSHESWESLKAEHAKALEQVSSRLPKQMRNCTIILKECAWGHSWLTAANWTDFGCPVCARKRARDEGRKEAQKAAAAAVTWWSERGNQAATAGAVSAVQRIANLSQEPEE